MSSRKRFPVFLILFVSILHGFAFRARASSSENTETLAIDNAEGAIALAYEAVLKAERVGANVSGLLSELNVAAKYLAQAHVSLRAGDTERATTFANLSRDISNKMYADANRLRDLAVEEAGQRFWLRTVESIIGVGLVIFGSFVSWRAFKRRYYHRVLKMKPEVVSDES